MDGSYTYLYGKNDNLSAIAGTYDINADYSSYVSVDLDKSRSNEHKFNLNLNGDYGLFGRRHEFNTGISYLNSKDYGPYYGDKDVPVADLRRFDGNIARPELPYLQDGYQQSKHLSVYGSTRFKLTDKWSLIGGMRLMNWKYAYRTERNRFADGRRSEKAFIPYLGTTYDITPNLTPRLLAQEIELAFVLGPVSASGAHNHVLCDYPIGFLASPSLGLGAGPVARQDLARFPIITFPRKTQPYETVRALFNAPDLPPIRLHASTSLATVIHMANEGLGIAVIPSAIVENELADGRLQLLDTDLKLPPLTFTASWLASPDAVAIERVANLARQIAQASVAVDGARVERH